MAYSKYHKAIVEEMEKLSNLKNTIFIGQQTASEDFYNTLKTIPKSKRYEMPVAEEMQLGMSIGLAMEGFLPISIYQRIDFLPRACDQLVNHLDIINKLSRGKFNPKVIIRTTVGTNNPFDVGLQHNKDLFLGIGGLLENVNVCTVIDVRGIRKAYKKALTSKNSSIIIEYQSLYEK